MNRIIKFGLDVHTTNYTICAAEPVLDGACIFHMQTQIKPELKLLLDVIEKFKERFKGDELPKTLVGKVAYRKLEEEETSKRS